MTIENMNQLKLIPHKDYTANRLVSGLLQLPNNTSLVIDETLLEQGQLDTPGMHRDARCLLLAVLRLARSGSGF
jgi:hypothetical protein